MPGQGAGDEDTCAGRTDQVQFVGSIGCPVDELLKGRRAQRQVDEPRDRGIWSGKPGAVMMQPFYASTDSRCGPANSGDRHHIIGASPARWRSGARG
ncbi:hypothetical protein I553_4199 [Mycobacterium xenopi 4042]|uniref:Uncharacterized protein n=1 Tax=Mycobacterium xenopi 4042 TaxID=1299334 RepID=X8AGG6_MYCXE|nr:hypothetical protein I553_4199 [Mycobacterium xenopi 4042]